MRSLSTLALVIALCGLSPEPTWANPQCNAHRARAWGAFVRCVENAAAGPYLNPAGSFNVFGTCRSTLTNAWPSPANNCSGVRFKVLSIGGVRTVEDRLTGLVWSQALAPKTWSAQGTDFRETGTAFADIHPERNQNRHGGALGWRMPSMVELQSLMGSPPTSTPFAAGFPAGFLPDDEFYWTSTSFPTAAPPSCQSMTCAWDIHFKNQAVGIDGKDGGGRRVAPVRGGL